MWSGSRALKKALHLKRKIKGKRLDLLILIISLIELLDYYKSISMKYCDLGPMGFIHILELDLVNLIFLKLSNDYFSKCANAPRLIYNAQNK